MIERNVIKAIERKMYVALNSNVLNSLSRDFISEDKYFITDDRNIFVPFNELFFYDNILVDSLIFLSALEERIVMVSSVRK